MTIASPDNVPVYPVYYYWKDEPEQIYGGIIAKITFAQQIMLDLVADQDADPAWIDFDESIFFYITEDEELEDLYHQDNGKDFVLVHIEEEDL